MHARPAVAAALVAAALAAFPAGASAGDPITVEGPGPCNGRMITIDETEKLEVRTLYFHGQNRIGNVDSAQDAYVGGSIRLTMDPSPPSVSSDSKVFVTRPTGVIGNPNSARNPYHGYWLREVDVEERIVCAGAKVFAATTTGTLTVQLWVDAPRGTGSTVTKSVQGTAPANTVSAFDVNFGELDVTAFESLLVQLDSATPGALTHYDSPAHPSQLNYVVVVAAD